jgi:tetraacyldisaccharide 4'-kinase
MPSLTAPRFWFRKSGLAAALLSPVAAIYDLAGKACRARVTPQHLPIPVICVGNVILGGSGKTPVVADIARRLKAAGHTPHIISRGYGGTLQGPAAVNLDAHSVGDVGDEPLLLARNAPVWVARNRADGAAAALQAGATHIILDDGLQNPSLAKSLSLLVIDAARALGNGHIIPAGPLRETLDDALSRTNAVIWIGEGHVFLKERIAAEKPVLEARAITHCLTHDLNKRPVLAFCGLGHAGKFYDGLAATGADIKLTRDFPDHYVWSTYEIEELLQQAEKLNALPVTTAKDAVRIPESLLPRIAICDVKLEWKDEAALGKLLKTGE